MSTKICARQTGFSFGVVAKQRLSPRWKSPPHAGRYITFAAFKRGVREMPAVETHSFSAWTWHSALHLMMKAGWRIMAAILPVADLRVRGVRKFARVTF